MLSSVDVSGSTLSLDPFPHCVVPSRLPQTTLREILEEVAHAELPWEQTTTDFYEQDEAALLGLQLPPALDALCHPSTLTSTEEAMCLIFGLSELKTTEVVLHRLKPSWGMGIHNDFLGGLESHRLVLQLDADNSNDAGGETLFFAGPGVESLRKIISPVPGVAIAFEISSKSYHAVRPVKKGTRTSLVYTFSK